LPFTAIPPISPRLNPPAGQRFLRSRHLFAVIAGISLGAAFPDFNITGLAWIAPGLMAAVALGTCGWRSFRIGYFAGLAFHLTTLHWLLNIPVAGFPILGWVALSAFLALYQTVWVWFVSSVQGQTSNETSWLARQTWALLGAAAWVALEMIQARLFSGFPWHLLGASQLRLTPLIQIALVTGIYGVSFVVVWAALSLVSAARILLARPTARYAWLGEMVLPLFVVLGLCVFGMIRLRDARDGERPTLRVAFVQPSIPQAMIWNEAENGRRFAELMRLTHQSLTNQPDLILWPEAALPTMLRYDETAAQAVTSFARTNHVWMILGSDDEEPAKHPTKPDEADYFNASFLISPEGEIAGRYCKRNLVIFGEYVPLVRWLPFVKWFTPIEAGFAAGEKVVPFEFQTNHAGSETGALRRVKTATLICFEDVFPHLVPAYVDADTDFLVNLTNDGWFGEDGEQWQHAATAAFRSVENGVPLLRACNNGLTCWIDSRGRIREVFRDARGSIHGAGVMVANIPILNADEKNPQTFYNRHGDWFGWACVALTAATAMGRARHSPKPR